MLFKYINDELQKTAAGSKYHLLTTKANLVLSNKPTDIEALSPCQQEEADTRMMLHLHHAAEQGHTKAYLWTVDSDAVVLVIHLFRELGFSELWIGFGSGTLYQQCMELAKKLHGMRGQLTHRHPHLRSPKTQPASHWNQCTCKFSNTGLYSCMVRTAVSSRSMKPGSFFSHMASSPWIQSS